MEAQKRRGLLMIDEMHLSTSVAFNRQKLQVQGFTNLGKYTPNHQVNKRADHALVLMFQPFQGKWVQTLACFLSKGCASSTVLHQIVIETITLTEQAGFYIDAVVSDGASWYRSMWNKFGITADHVSCTHIVEDPSRQLWFISDFPHLVKCLRNFIIQWAETWTPDGIIKLQHWLSLIEAENPVGYNLKLNYKLTSDHIKPRYYQKMNVALAFQFFGVGPAMEALDHYNELRDSQPTQTFCKQVYELIDAMNTRTPPGALKLDSKEWKVIHSFRDYIIKWENVAIKENYNFSL